MLRCWGGALGFWGALAGVRVSWEEVRVLQGVLGCPGGGVLWCWGGPWGFGVSWGGQGAPWGFRVTPGGSGCPGEGRWVAGRGHLILGCTWGGVRVSWGGSGSSRGLWGAGGGTYLDAGGLEPPGGGVAAQQQQEVGGRGPPPREQHPQGEPQPGTQALHLGGHGGGVRGQDPPPRNPRFWVPPTKGDPGIWVPLPQAQGP